MQRWRDLICSAEAATLALVICGIGFTLWPPELTIAKLSVVVAFTAIGVWQLLATREAAAKAKDESDSSYESLHKKLDFISQTIAAAEKVQISAEPLKTGLKRDALSLAAEILLFVGQRKSLEPPLGRVFEYSPTHFGQVELRSPYEAETISLYQDRYGARVRAIIQELEQRVGLDGAFLIFAKEPVLTLDLKIIAERIGSIAERLESD